MIAYSDSDDTTSGLVIIDSESTATATQGEWISCHNQEKIEEDDIDKSGLWLLTEYYIERKEHLRSLWFAVLREKRANLGLWLGHRQYCRRQMLSFSGWVAKTGYRKKKN